MLDSVVSQQRLKRKQCCVRKHVGFEENDLAFILNLCSVKNLFRKRAT